ncbi:MAG: radical SAM protein [Myxococcota bacterium]|nr:radical SAM protein [Myxococcota bacterium]
MTTRVLLIDAQGHWLKKFEGEVDQVVLPLGLMYLASYGRQALGDQVEFEIYNSVVDLNDNDPEAIEACIRKADPHIVGIRGMTRYQKEFAQVASIAKATSSALVVGGGPYISSDEHAGLVDNDIDVAVLDEGEYTFAEVIDHYRRGAPFDDIAGIALRTDEGIRRTPKRPFLTAEELDALPFPAYDLVDMDRYAQMLSYGYNKRRQGVLYTSRGCPYRCDFCHVLFGKRFRERSPESLMAEVSWLYDHWEVRDFYIVDDIFNLQNERAIEFFEMVSASPMNGKVRFYFVNGLRGDRVDPAFIDAAVKAGVVWLAYAVETASARLQKQIQKHLDVDKVKKTIEYSYAKDVAVIYWGMLGIDTETIEEAQATVELLNSMPPSTIPMLFSLKPYPGTGAYEKLKAREAELSESMKFHFQDTGTEYHSFLGLMRKNPDYYGVLRTWGDHVASEERMRTCTQNLMKIGHTDDDIRTAYQLLYRKLSAATVDELIAWCRADLLEGAHPTGVAASPRR